MTSADDPTLPEQISAYAHMQARLVALLLRHDEQRFGQFFDIQQRFGAEENDALQHYRDLAVLFRLSEELFEHILPRIVRRLSFESPRATIIEEPPPRGRVDWERTLAATWTERPGEPPLQLHTRQRQRDFATPENLLTVVTLLQYRTDLQQLLWGEYSMIGAESLRHPLTESVARCERKLAFPQFAGIRSMAQQLLEQDGSAALEAQVQERLIPGSNSAYEELLDWRVRYQSLRLLQRQQLDISDDVLGVHPDRDNYLYQLWIYFELADFLKRSDALLHWNQREGQLLFRWGTGAQERRYRLSYDRAILDRSRYPIWPHAPGVRPDFYIAHETPEQIADKDTKLLWREPGYMLDAKYYRPREENDPKTPAGPIKRMLADLQLSGEQHGALLFAFHGYLPTPSNPSHRADGQEQPGSKALDTVRQIKADWPRAQSVLPDTRIALYRIAPQASNSAADHDVLLRTLLDDVHAALMQRRKPECHGIFLDTLSLAAAGPLVDHWNHKLESSATDLLICPKPHIGAWRVDLVSRAKHCCANARFCHIIGQPNAQKPLRPPRDIKDLLGELDQILQAPGPELPDEYGEAAARIAERVQKLTRSFAELANVDFEFYYKRLHDLGMAHTLDMLDPIEQESLALGEFLKDQLDRIKANDYSAPAIHISSVMEREVKSRIFSGVSLEGPIADPKNQTLGRLPTMKTWDWDNWKRIEAHAAIHWHPQPDPNDLERRVRFEDFVKKALSRIAPLRNHAAHTEPLPRSDYTELQSIIYQGNYLGYSALNALLLCWKEKNIE